MSPEQTIFLLSMIGAMLFIGVGFFGARASQVREGPRVPPPPPPPQPPVDRTEANHLKAQIAALEAKLAHAAEESEHRARDAEHRARDAEHRAREVERSVQEAERRMHEADRRAREAERMAEEVSEAKRALESQDLDLELTSLRMKIADLERLREENARLRVAAKDHAAVRAEVKRLEAERTRLEALAFANPVGELELPAAPTKPGAFEAIVHEVARGSGVRAVAIADELGFTIAGIGSEQEGLAALAGLLADLERRAQMLLPVGSIRRITLEMDHGADVSVCPIARSDTRIALATLTVGPRPDTVSLTGAIERVGDLLFR